MPAPLFQCVPNLSEGRRKNLIDRIVQEAQDPQVELVHRTSDIDHNRTVLTFLGSPAGLVRALERLVDRAFDLLDLRDHHGVHPRLGLVDVIPFVPIENATLEDAAALARTVARALSSRAPVFLYECAATSNDRKDLAAHRRGGLIGLAARIEEQHWLPDFGSASFDPRHGVLLVGARAPLIAFNVDLDSPDPAAAQRIAKRIRQSSPGGLPGVKALGLALPSRALSQVSMNIVAPETTSLYSIVARIRREARTEDVRIVGSELIGLMPREATLFALREALQLPELSAERVLEHHLSRPTLRQDPPSD
jgi:glutamate formiminotransferase